MTKLRISVITSLLLGAVSLAHANVEIRKSGSSWAVIEDDGTIRIHGSSVGTFERDGTVRKSGSSIGTVEHDGTIRKSGSSIGSIEHDGTIRLHGSSWGSASPCCSGAHDQQAVAAVLVFFSDFF